MSKIEVNQISSQCGSTLTIGQSGDSIQLACGATQTGFGRTGTVDWDTTAKTASFTAVSGNGYFVNTTSGAVTVTLPATPSAGDIVSIADYANTFATNNLTVARNGSLINGSGFDYESSTNGISLTFVYVDGTRGWKNVNDGTTNATGINPFVLATGGTITTCGDFKTHIFTSPGTFTVTCAGTTCGSNSVEYLVVAGGGGGGSGVNAASPRAGGGGGAGGFRQNYPSPTSAGLPITAQAYPITVGGGGTGSPTPSPSNIGTNGSNSIFSSITSAGGGFGQNSYCQASPTEAGPGGSGGGGSAGGVNASVGGTGNTPPVSPPQGNNGGGGNTGPGMGGHGGGGAGAAGSNVIPPCQAGPGGIGSPIATTFIGPTAPSYGESGPAPGRYFAGGGGGGGAENGIRCGGAGGAGGGGDGATYPTPGAAPNGTANTGGGAGGGTGEPCGRAGGAGGSGIVIIRYKYQ